MEGYIKGVRIVSSFMNGIAAVALSFVIALTTLDVILRIFKHPILGTFEMVAFTGAVTFGFAVPMTSWHRAHIYVDFLVQKLPQERRNVVNIFTRLAAIGLFAIASFNLFKHGIYLYQTGEYSPTLQIPFYPFMMGLGVAFVLECLVLIADIFKIVRGEYE
jgi:TRAP-type C4-dicarboxylate transport system permease small subunit